MGSKHTLESSFLEEVLKPSPLGKKVIGEKEEDENKATELTPHEAYIKFLQMYGVTSLIQTGHKNPENSFLLTLNLNYYNIRLTL